MLALNNALDAFWMGNLKIRDIKGQEISSQIIDKDDDEEDEDNLEENDQSDVELNDDNSDDRSENSNGPPEEESVEY